MIFYEKEYPQTIPWLSVRSYVCLFSGGSMLCRRCSRPRSGNQLLHGEYQRRSVCSDGSEWESVSQRQCDWPPGSRTVQDRAGDPEKAGNQWITVDSWSVEKDGRNANLSKSVEAKKGTTYRAKVKMTVWLDGKSETKTITTSGKTA